MQLISVKTLQKLALSDVVGSFHRRPKQQANFDVLVERGYATKQADPTGSQALGTTYRYSITESGRQFLRSLDEIPF